jgi:drug/metabolite transporter (DMT)-like permease
MAADSAVKAAGFSLDQLSQATAQDFVLVMFVMSIGIIAGLCLSPFVAKKIQAGTMKLKAGDKRWGALAGSIFILVIIVVFVTPMFLDYSTAGIVRLLTVFTSVGITILLGVLAKQEKLSWLKSFILAISLILAMASSVLWTGLLS